MTNPENDPAPLHVALSRYQVEFGELPPLMAWDGPDMALVELLEIAVRTGRQLDESDLARAMGREPAPPMVLL